jgi:transcriptional regulator with XRE-family HTH domain
MEELTRIREDLGWSQQKLADESRVNKATINQIERGRRSPNVETLEKLAGAMGREIGDFFPKAQASLPLFEDAEDPHSALHALKPLLDYMKQRAKDYEEELEDENSLYFRNADIAARWAEGLNKEARGLSGLLVEEARPHMTSIRSTKEKARIAVDLLRHIATLFNVSRQAETRIEAMRTQPDDLGRKRMEKAQREFQEMLQESEESIDQWRRAASD